MGARTHHAHLRAHSALARRLADGDASKHPQQARNEQASGAGKQSRQATTSPSRGRHVAQTGPWRSRAHRAVQGSEQKAPEMRDLATRQAQHRTRDEIKGQQAGAPSAASYEEAEGELGLVGARGV
jgi:hypothetical protein